MKPRPRRRSQGAVLAAQSLIRRFLQNEANAMFSKSTCFIDLHFTRIVEQIHGIHRRAEKPTSGQSSSPGATCPRLFLSEPERLI